MGSTPTRPTLNKFMTTSNKSSKKIKEEYVSSRQWAEECLETIKKMQDEYLDRYYNDKKDSANMLKLLNKLVTQLEKKL